MAAISLAVRVLHTPGYIVDGFHATRCFNFLSGSGPEEPSSQVNVAGHPRTLNSAETAPVPVS